MPLVNPRDLTLVSRRVGNYQYSPNGFGALIAQLWVE